VDGLPQLARLFPGTGTHDGISADDPALERTVLYESVVRLLERAADRTPVVLFIDDLHWADPASVELLHYLVRRLTTQPVLVVLTARQAELGSDRALRGLLASLRRTGVAHEISVGRLDEGDVEVMTTRDARL
jgi:predicted ATPase